MGAARKASALFPPSRAHGKPVGVILGGKPPRINGVVVFGGARRGLVVRHHQHGALEPIQVGGRVLKRAVEAIRQCPRRVSRVGGRDKVGAVVVGHIGRAVAEVVEVVPESADHDLTKVATQANMHKTGVGVAVLLEVNAGLILIKTLQTAAQIVGATHAETRPVATNVGAIVAVNLEIILGRTLGRPNHANRCVKSLGRRSVAHAGGVLRRQRGRRGKRGRNGKCKSLFFHFCFLLWNKCASRIETPDKPL